MRSPLAKPLFCIFVYVLYVAIRRVRQCCVADAVNTHESADTDIVLIPLPRRCLEKSFKRRESSFPWAYIHFCTTTRYVFFFVFFWNWIFIVHHQVCYTHTNDLVFVSANFIFPSIGLFSHAVSCIYRFFFFFHDILFCSESKSDPDCFLIIVKAPRLKMSF